MKTDIITVAVLFLVIILLSLWFSATPSYIPYSASIKTNYSTFEAFHPQALEYSTTEKNVALDGQTSDYLLKSDDKAEFKAVGGFSGHGVFQNPGSNYKNQLDLYSEAEGSLTCQGFGYFNSRGPLCLSEKMKQQLSTRGMNASGSPSIIGGSAV